MRTPASRRLIAVVAIAATLAVAASDGGAQTSGQGEAAYRTAASAQLSLVGVTDSAGTPLATPPPGFQINPGVDTSSLITNALSGTGDSQVEESPGDTADTPGSLIDLRAIMSGSASSAGLVDTELASRRTLVVANESEADVIVTVGLEAELSAAASANDPTLAAVGNVFAQFSLGLIGPGQAADTCVTGGLAEQRVEAAPGAGLADPAVASTSDRWAVQIPAGTTCELVVSIALAGRAHAIAPPPTPTATVAPVAGKDLKAKAAPAPAFTG